MTQTPWAKYLASLPIYDRVLIAHDNPNNTKLIDRAVEKGQMELREAVNAALWTAECKVDAILGRTVGERITQQYIEATP